MEALKLNLPEFRHGPKDPSLKGHIGNQGGCEAPVKGGAAGGGVSAQRAAPFTGVEDSTTPRVPKPFGLVTTRTSRRVGVEPSRFKPHEETSANPVPGYVARCPGSQYTSHLKPLTLWTWDPANPVGARRMVARCKSWRCAGCQPFRASVDFARIEEALEPYQHDDVTFVVLTIDRNGRYGDREWESPREAYLELSRMQGLFMKRVNRLLVRKGLDPVGSRWVSTVEAHKSGWPHLNIVMVSKGLAGLVGEASAERLAAGLTAREATLVTGELEEATVGAGFGVQSTMEVARSKRALAGYVVKVAKTHDESFRAVAGEVVKMTQVPLNAPKGLRRIRAGIRFLPPRRASGKTGAIVERGEGFARPVGRKPKATAMDPDKAKARKRRERVMNILLRGEITLEPSYAEDPEGRKPEGVTGFAGVEDPDIRAALERLQLTFKAEDDDG